MSQDLGQLVSTFAFRTCFKHSAKGTDANDTDRTAVSNCVSKLLEAFKVVAPSVATSYKELPQFNIPHPGAEGEE